MKTIIKVCLCVGTILVGESITAECYKEISLEDLPSVPKVPLLKQPQHEIPQFPPVNPIEPVSPKREQPAVQKSRQFIVKDTALQPVVNVNDEAKNILETLDLRDMLFKEKDPANILLIKFKLAQLGCRESRSYFYEKVIKELVPQDQFAIDYGKRKLESLLSCVNKIDIQFQNLKEEMLRNFDYLRSDTEYMEAIGYVSKSITDLKGRVERLLNVPGTLINCIEISLTEKWAANYGYCNLNCPSPQGFGARTQRPIFTKPIVGSSNSLVQMGENLRRTLTDSIALLSITRESAYMDSGYYSHAINILPYCLEVLFGRCNSVLENNSSLKMQFADLYDHAYEGIKEENTIVMAGDYLNNLYLESIGWSSDLK